MYLSRAPGGPRPGTRLLTGRWAMRAITTASLALALSPVLAAPARAVTVPYEGISIYVTSNNLTNVNTLGCQQGTLDKNRPGTQHSLVSLAFGGPVSFGNGVYGSTMWSAPDVTTTQILALAKEYAKGYWVCTGSDTASVAEVSLTTNNSTSGVTNAHGQAWARMVNDFATWLSGSSYGSQVVASGGNDIEPGFGDPTPARNWVAGYAAVYTRRLLNTGSADGCPSGHIPSSTECGTSTHPSWGPEDIWYVSWGAAPSWPVPEIYTTNGVQAQQWYWLSRYAVSAHGSAMGFWGVATQWRACQHASCSGTNNTVSAGYTQLYNALAQNASTATTPFYSTDFDWDYNEL